ncbi:MAG: YbaN family protein [Pseudomonadota bacterium]
MAWLCVGLGVLGIFLPLLPTTPFLLVALWGFMNSSPRLAHWLRNHKVMGPYVTDWSDHGIVPVKAKALAITMMSASMIWLAVFSEAHRVVVAVVGVILVCVAIWLVRRPSEPSGGP